MIALALLRAHQTSGRQQYLETGERVLAALGRDVKTVLTGDESETRSPRQVAATVFYLRAYAEAFR